MTWLVALGLIALAITGAERFVRSRGYVPSVKDDDQAWAWARARVADGSPRTVAVLGASRILLAFSSEAFADALPRWRSVQLAIQGSAPIGTLRDLAADPEFRGVALVDMTEYAFDPSRWHLQDSAITAYHRRWRAPGAMAERWLATQVQARVALLAGGGLRVIGGLWRTGTWPLPPYTITHADRTKFADYALTDVAGQRRTQLARIEGWDTTPSDPDAWLTDALAEEPFIDAIQARGGRVVYVRMPTCDERWELDEHKTPKAVFWDRLATQSHAVMIHFKDHAALSAFACPDTSHIASADGPRFTRALIDVLVARGVIAP